MTGAGGRPDGRALGAGAFLLLLAGLVWRDAAAQTFAASYGPGPAAMPLVVAAALGLLGLGHLVVAFRGGLPRTEGAIDPAAIGWIGLGLAGLIALVGLGGGFAPAAAVLFAATARAFGRRAVLADLAIGLVIGVVIYLLFARLLSLSLPMGPLERLLG